MQPHQIITVLKLQQTAVTHFVQTHLSILGQKELLGTLLQTKLKYTTYLLHVH